MFYFYVLALTLFHIVFYAFFRGSVYDALRLSKVSKTYIRKHRKGFNNYWFYSDVHKEHPLGLSYWLNLVFLPLLVAFSLISVCFGYLAVLRAPLTVLSILLCLIEIPCSIRISKIDALTEYGKPFVFLARRRDSRGYYSSVLYLAAWVIPVALTVLCVMDR